MLSSRASSTPLKIPPASSPTPNSTPSAPERRPTNVSIDAQPRAATLRELPSRVRYSFNHAGSLRHSVLRAPHVAARADISKRTSSDGARLVQAAPQLD